MDEAEIPVSRFDTPTVALIVFAAFCAAMYVAYKRYLNNSLAIQEAVALETLNRKPTYVAAPNGQVTVQEAEVVTPTVPVIKDDETGAVVESTTGPGKIKENLPDGTDQPTNTNAA